MAICLRVRSLVRKANYGSLRSGRRSRLALIVGAVVLSTFVLYELAEAMQGLASHPRVTETLTRNFCPAVSGKLALNMMRLETQFGPRMKEVLDNPRLPTRDSPAADREAVQWRNNRRNLIRNELDFVAPSQRPRSDAAVRRPRIGIIQIATTPWNSMYAVETMSTQCYAAKRGYGYHLAPMILQTDRHLFSGRFRHSLQYLPFYDYVVHLALDMIVVNASKRIEDMPGFGQSDVMVPLRNFYKHDPGNYASWPSLGDFTVVEHPHTELLIVKNSPVGRRFLEQMVALADERESRGYLDGILWDMGDIHAVIASAVYGEAKAARCNKFLLDYRKNGNNWFVRNVRDNPNILGLPTHVHPLYYLSMHYHMSECSAAFTPGKHGPVHIFGHGEVSREINSDHQRFRKGLEFFIHTKRIREFASSEVLYCVPDANGNLAAAEKWWATPQEAVDQSEIERLIVEPLQLPDRPRECSTDTPMGCPACSYGGDYCPCSGIIAFRKPGSDEWSLQKGNGARIEKCKLGDNHGVCRCVNGGKDPRDILTVRDSRAAMGTNYLARYQRSMGVPFPVLK